MIFISTSVCKTSACDLQPVSLALSLCKLSLPLTIMLTKPHFQINDTNKTRIYDVTTATAYKYIFLADYLGHFRKMECSNKTHPGLFTRRASRVKFKNFFFFLSITLKAPRRLTPTDIHSFHPPDWRKRLEILKQKPHCLFFAGRLKAKGVFFFFSRRAFSVLKS